MNKRNMFYGLCGEERRKAIEEKILSCLHERIGTRPGDLAIRIGYISKDTFCTQSNRRNTPSYILKKFIKDGRVIEKIHRISSDNRRFKLYFLNKKPMETNVSTQSNNGVELTQQDKPRDYNFAINSTIRQLLDIVTELVEKRFKDKITVLEEQSKILRRQVEELRETQKKEELNGGFVGRLNRYL